MPVVPRGLTYCIRILCKFVHVHTYVHTYVRTYVYVSIVHKIEVYVYTVPISVQEPTVISELLKEKIVQVAASRDHTVFLTRKYVCTVHMHVRMYVCMHVHMHVRMYVRTYVCVLVSNVIVLLALDILFCCCE